MLIFANVAAVGLWILNLGYKNFRKKVIFWELQTLYLGLFASALMWFFMAPFIRYGLGFLLLLLVLGIAEWMSYVKKGMQSIAAGTLVALIMFCFSSYVDMYTMEMIGFVKDWVREPYYFAARDYDDGSTDSIEIKGNTIYYNDYRTEEGERNSYFYYPNTAYQFMLERSTLAGDDIKDGFIPVYP